MATKAFPSAISNDGAAVLNAEDPLVAEMAAATEARVIYFSSSPEHHVMAVHLATEGWGMYVDNYTIPGNDRPTNGKRDTPRRPRQPAGRPRRPGARPATGKAVRPARHRG